MTLYLWIHWFWITICIKSLACSALPVFSTDNPPMTVATTTPVTKPVKKGHSLKFNKTPATHSLNKTTVIDENATSPILETTEVYNNTPNLTLFEFENETFATAPDDSMEGGLSAASITGITMGCVSVVGVVCAVSFIVYRNRGFNRPQVLNDRCSNPDSSGYIDDASIRDNSEEMYSLDNDSFLNSLEAMTIQNYWTDTVKHTKL